ncbi:MAG TPA: YetF domain-containing protein [Pyrinomonadaceae bacterium]|nr:YetF domain-containing protein [Pyrinomonadaceae bacterium]
MDKIFSPDWQSIFVPSTSLLEVVVRGTIVYLLLFAFMRFVRRDSGMLNIADLLVVVLIADAAQNAMGSEYKSVTEGALLVGTIIFWDYTLDWLGYRFRAIGRVLHPPALALVEDGRMNRRNMRREMITEDELMSQLREQGVERVAEVKRASLEGDGRVSVIKKESAGGDDQNRAPEKMSG